MKSQDIHKEFSYTLFWLHVQLHALTELIWRSPLIWLSFQVKSTNTEFFLSTHKEQQETQDGKEKVAIEVWKSQTELHS